MWIRRRGAFKRAFSPHSRKPKRTASTASDMVTTPRISSGLTSNGCIPSSLSDRRRHLRASNEIFAPALEVRVSIVDHRAVALTPGVKGNIAHIRERVFADQIFSAGHLFVQSREVLFHTLPGFVRLSIMGDVGSGGMQPGAHIVDPDPCSGAKQEIGGHERDLGKLLFQVLVDDRRFVDDTVAVDQYRHFAVGILSGQVFGFVLEIYLDEIIGNFLLRQDNPCPVGVGSGVTGIEFHVVPSCSGQYQLGSNRSSRSSGSNRPTKKASESKRVLSS